MRRPFPLAIFTAVTAVLGASSAMAQTPVGPNVVAVAPATTLTASRPHGGTRSLVATPSDVGDAALPTGCVAPCRLTLVPGSYRVSLFDSHADGRATRVSATLDLAPETTHVRVRRLAGARTAGAASIALGGVTAAVGTIVTVAGVGSCPLTFPISFSAGPPCTNTVPVATGLGIAGSGAVGIVTGSILLAVSHPRLEATHATRPRVTSVAVAPTSGGASAAMTWTF